MASARSTLITVMLVSFLSTAGVALPYPVLAPYFLGGNGAPSLTAFMGLHPKLLLGVLLAVYPLGILVGSSFLGALSDHLGRKRVLVVSLALGALGYALTAAAVVIASFPLLALARMLTGVCEGNDAVARAIALDLHPAINRTRALTLVFATTYAGWLAGPLVGGYLMVLGMGAVFFCAGLALAGCAVFARFALLETVSAAPVQRRPRLLEAMRGDNSLHLWREPAIRQMLVFHLLYTLGLNACYEFYPLWLVEYFGASSTQIGWLTVYMTGTMIFTSVFLVTRLRARFAPLALVKAGTALFAALMAALVVTPEALIPPLFMAIGMMISINSGSFPEYMAERFADSSGAGRVMGIISTNFYVANVLIALGGSVIALAGSRWSLLLGGALCAAAVVWLRRVPDQAVPVRAEAVA